MIAPLSKRVIGKSDRVQGGVEVPAWVLEEIKKLETDLMIMTDMAYSANGNCRSVNALLVKSKYHPQLVESMGAASWCDRISETIDLHKPANYF